MTQYITNAYKHLKTINKHRALVLENCIRAGIPLQGLVHDLSKYSPTEFLAGVRYYQGNHSPNDEQRRVKGYSEAWLHHKGRNKHHYEYWYDYSRVTHKLEPVEMPVKYLIEMFCDRIAASKVYKGDQYDDSCPMKYFSGAKKLYASGYEGMMHPATEAELEHLLTMLAEKGEKETFRYIRKMKK